MRKKNKENQAIKGIVFLILGLILYLAFINLLPEPEKKDIEITNEQAVYMHNNPIEGRDEYCDQNPSKDICRLGR